MKICILTPRFPMPENGGDVLRINNIARYLKAKGHELILVSFCERDYDMEAAQRLYDKVYTVRRRGFVSMFYAGWFWLQGKPIQCGYYFSPSFDRLFRKVVKEECPDRYIAHLLRMVPYLERNRLQQNSEVEMTDALSKTYDMSAGAKGGRLKRHIYNIEKKLIRRFEQHVLCSFPKVILVSQADIDYLCLSAKRKWHSLALCTNGVECGELPTMKYDALKLCFIGNMRTLQNQDAVFYFVEKIFPLIQKELPAVKFYIIGAEPPYQIQELEKKGNIVVTGFVEDIAEVISDVCLTVAPVRVAAGIQNKVLVAMANGLPVVMTSVISQAIPEAKHEENCLICDDARDFAAACLQVIRDGELRNRLAKNGYNMVARHYSWNEKLEGYENFAVVQKEKI